MDQYIRTPLHLPHLRVRTGATNSFINDVPSYVIHGAMTSLLEGIVMSISGLCRE